MKTRIDKIRILQIEREFNLSTLGMKILSLITGGYLILSIYGWIYNPGFLDIPVPYQLMNVLTGIFLLSITLINWIYNNQLQLLLQKAGKTN